MGYVIDSNVVIDYLSEKLPNQSLRWLDTVIDDIPTISVITRIEIIGYKHPPVTERLFIDFVNASSVIPLSEQIIEQTIDIRKKHKIKMPDAIVAATAIVLNLTLITHDVDDFRKIGKLKIIDPWSI